MAIKKTTGEDYNHPDTVLTEYTYRQGVTEGSSRVIHIDCPFCESSVKTYVWSLCGGGKSCDCGAMFYSSGAAFKRAY